MCGIVTINYLQTRQLAKTNFLLHQESSQMSWLMRKWHTLASMHTLAVLPEPSLFALIIYEPPHDKTKKMICVPSQDSDQPGHLPSLIRVLAVHSVVAQDPRFLHADSEDSDQTGQMPRLIWIFAWCMSFCWFCHVAAHLGILMTMEESWGTYHYNTVCLMFSTIPGLQAIVSTQLDWTDEGCSRTTWTQLGSDDVGCWETTWTQLSSAKVESSISRFGTFLIMVPSLCSKTTSAVVTRLGEFSVPLATATFSSTSFLSAIQAAATGNSNEVFEIFLVVWLSTSSQAYSADFVRLDGFFVPFIVTIFWAWVEFNESIVDDGISPLGIFFTASLSASSQTGSSGAGWICANFDVGWLSSFMHLDMLFVSWSVWLFGTFVTMSLSQSSLRFRLFVSLEKKT